VVREKITDKGIETVFSLIMNFARFPQAFIQEFAKLGKQQWSE
jgi:hypothetical protein